MASSLLVAQPFLSSCAVAMQSKAIPPLAGTKVTRRAFSNRATRLKEDVRTSTSIAHRTTHTDILSPVPDHCT